ncbi:hypothetical protein M0805_005458 [Coniferiporia weirii]|nr:hypothetical protein M0805_005458 [Coniferiporia weirii]
MSESACCGASDSQTIPFKSSTGIVFWGSASASLGAFSAFELFTRLKPHGIHDMRRASILILAAFSMSLGSWACQRKSCLTYLIKPLLKQLENFCMFQFIAASEPALALVVSFKPGFVALSLCVPTMLILGSFVILDLRDTLGLWGCGLCGVVVGLSAGFMHYALYISLPTFDTLFSTAQVFLSLLLITSASLFSFLSATLCWPKWERCIWMRMAVSVVLGCSISGANYLSLSGTKFSPRASAFFDPEQSVQNQRRTKILTLVIPAWISIALACLSIIITLFSATKTSRQPRPLPGLIVASISFTGDGRVLVDDKGFIPARAVDLGGIPEEIVDELDIRRSLFHWLLSLSCDWEILTPFLSRITQRSRLPSDAQPSPWRFFLTIHSYFSRSQCSCTVLPPRAALKLRLLEAIAQLAVDLGLALGDLGTLHDAVLETGARVNIAEFLLLSEHAASESRSVESALKDRVPPGRMLFFVRELPHRSQTTSSSVLSSSFRPVALTNIDSCCNYSLPRNYAGRGYKLLFMRRFRDTMAEATGAMQEDVDKILLGCRDYAVSGMRPVLEERGVYVSLLTERWTEDGSTEVLVYNFAKHQIPSCRLDVPRMTPQMHAWLRDMAGLSVSELTRVCNDDVAQCHNSPPFFQNRVQVPTSRPAFDSGVSRERAALLKFQEALVSALEQLMRDVAFVGNDLPARARLTPHILDVPSASSIDGGSPAHMVVLRARATRLGLNGDLDLGSDFVHISDDARQHMRFRGDTPPSTPSVFAYTPRALFDITHALVCSERARSAFRCRAAPELEHILPSRASADTDMDSPDQREESGSDELCRRLPPALVSSFSIDTLTDGGADRPSRARVVVERVCSGWTEVLRRVRSVSRTRTRTRSTRRAPERTTPNVTIKSASPAFLGTRSAMDLGRADDLVEPSRSYDGPLFDGEGPATPKGRYTNRYSRRQEPPKPPFVIADHPFARCGTSKEVAARSSCWAI